MRVVLLVRLVGFNCHRTPDEPVETRWSTKIGGEIVPRNLVCDPFVGRIALADDAVFPSDMVGRHLQELGEKRLEVELGNRFRSTDVHARLREHKVHEEANVDCGVEVRVEDATCDAS